mmetsp:Transcript_62809/g.187279  ORF Transcript_62809/g.187279 Transcript_62809/m.187279 type:complete len:318 (+) Transcript_62809:373-1326(+)
MYRGQEEGARRGPEARSGETRRGAQGGPSPNRLAARRGRGGAPRRDGAESERPHQSAQPGARRAGTPRSRKRGFAAQLADRSTGWQRLQLPECCGRGRGGHEHLVVRQSQRGCGDRHLGSRRGVLSSGRWWRRCPRSAPLHQLRLKPLSSSDGRPTAGARWAAAAAERVLRSAGAGAVGPLRPDGHGFGKGVFASGGAKEAARSRRQAPAEYRGVRCRRKTARHACGKERLDVADVIHAGRLARQSHGRTRWIADGVRVGEAKATAAAASAAPLPTGAANTFAAELQLAGLAGSPAERQPMALSDVARPHVHVLGRG